ncbi:MAG: integrase core domain-containing protein [Aliidiomarina sp.]|nr:integrase core domain-containing protein [Aliidiomarina sp.]
MNTTLGYINNIKPSLGARIERFHQSFEAEFLSASSFLTLAQFRELASIWRMNYNERVNPN